MALNNQQILLSAEGISSRSWQTVFIFRTLSQLDRIFSKMNLVHIRTVCFRNRFLFCPSIYV